MQVHIPQGELVLVALIAEVYVVKVDIAVLDLGHRVFRIVQVGLLLEDLDDTLCARLGHGDHDKHHRNHHQAHQNLHRVGEQAGQLAGGHAAADDQARAEPRDQQHAGVHAELHERSNARHRLLRLGELLIEQAGNALELLGLVLLAHIGLDHADAAHVFLHDRVHAVIGLEHALEDRADKLHQQAQADRQHWQHAEEDERKLAVDLERHHERKDQHDRAAHRDARAHLERVLHVGDVGRQAGDDRAGRELINIGKGIILHRVIHIVAQVAGKAGRSTRGIGARRCAEDQRQRRAGDQDNAVLPYLAHVMRIDAPVDQKRHHRRDDDLHHDLEHDKKRREQRIFLKLTHAFQQSFDHSVFPPKICVGNFPD